MNHHHHHEDNSAELKGALSEREKLGRLLEYWIKHNEEHANTYLEWSKKATADGLEDVAEILNDAANTALSLNARFKEALKKL
jgi:rubrerythrin